MSAFIIHGAAALLWGTALLFATAAGFVRAKAGDTSAAVSIAVLLAAIAFTLQVIA